MRAPKRSCLVIARFHWRARKREQLEVLDPSALASLFKALCQEDLSHEDCLVFLPDSVRAERIKEEQDCEGVRIRLRALLQNARIDLQIDKAATTTIQKQVIRARAQKEAAVLLENAQMHLVGTVRDVRYGSDGVAELTVGKFDTPGYDNQSQKTLIYFSSSGILRARRETIYLLFPLRFALVHEWGGLHRQQSR